VEKEFYSAVDDLQPKKKFVVYPGSERLSLRCCSRSRATMSVPEPKAVFGRVLYQVGKVPTADIGREQMR
jgi:hypothetical protein